MIESKWWLPYGPQGFVPVAVHVGPGARFAHAIYAEQGLTMPAWYDLDRRLFEDYVPRGVGAGPFPLHVLLDADGVVADVSAELPEAAYDELIPELLEAGRERARAGGGR